MYINYINQHLNITEKNGVVLLFDSILDKALIQLDLVQKSLNSAAIPQHINIFRVCIKSGVRNRVKSSRGNQIHRHFP